MKKAADVDAYIAAAAEPARGMLKKMREIIKAAARSVSRCPLR